MNIRNGLPGSLTLLALLISSHALAVSERPQPRNYGSYTDFLRAVVDYTKHNGTGMPDETGTDPSSLSGDSMSSRDDPSSPDALEQAIALARDGLIQRYEDNSNTRTTFSSFPMQPVDAGDLAQVSLIDALTGLMITERDVRIRLNIDPSKFTDPLALIDARLLADEVILEFDRLALQQELFSNVLPFAGGNFIWSVDNGNYYSVVNTSPSYIDGNGLSLSFSAQASVRAAIVDSNGLSPSLPYAGAVVIDPLNIKTNTIVGNLFARNDGTGNTSIVAALDAQGDISFDLSNTNIGVASATRSGSTWIIGEASNFLAFGPSSIISIRMDEPLEAVISNPDNGTNTPLLRINGRISQLVLSEMALLDGNSGHGIHFGRISIDNLALANTSVYFENDAIRVDMGKGTDNLHMTIESLVFGGTMQDRANGTLPAAIGDAEITVSTQDNMQITLRAH